MRPGWNKKFLGDLVQIKPPKSEARKVLSPTQLVSFVPMEDLKEVQRSFEPKQKRPLSDVYGGYTYFAENDVLLAKITPCFENGKLSIARGLINGIGFGSSEFMVLRCGKDLSPDYLFYFLSRDEFREHGKGRMTGAVGHKRVPPEFVETQPIPLPPLEEQRRIVAVLDEAFEGLARAHANAEENLKDARELFANFAAAAFESRNGTTGHYSTLGEVCTIQSGAGFPDRHQGRSSGKYPFYKVSDMNLVGNEEALTVANNYVSETVRSELRAKLFPEGSIVFPKVGGAIATNKKRVVAASGCVDNNIMGLIPDENALEREYLHEWLRVLNIYEFSNKANPPSITQMTVAAWPIWLPSRDEQQRIVASIQEFRKETSALAQRYADHAHSLDSLRHSLLQKAFSGELT